ncbi:hypothetical protein E2320_006118, partial [Naja naja]
KRAKAEAGSEWELIQPPTHGTWPSIRLGEKSIPSVYVDHVDRSEDSSQEFERLKELLSQSEEMLDSKALFVKKELLKDQLELDHLEKESLVEIEEEMLSSSESKVQEGESSDLDESENTLILYKLLEFQKFSNLREERKHEEMMGTIERENCKLQQEVTKLEVQLADRDQAIHTLQINIQQLQSELLFERFRSKIIQAAYSTPGTKSPQAEITDEEVLEALQKIITDRLDFHQMLKQKGVKVPSLSSEPAPPPTHKKKGGGK